MSVASSDVCINRFSDTVIANDAFLEASRLRIGTGYGEPNLEQYRFDGGDGAPAVVCEELDVTVSTHPKPTLDIQ